MNTTLAIHDASDWLACDQPEEMERVLGELGSPRRWRLFACACCWRILSLLEDERCREAVLAAERVAEGITTVYHEQETLLAVQAAEVQAWQRRGQASLAWAATAARTALSAPRRTYTAAARATGTGEVAERRAQCQVMRDLFGNPFHPVLFDPAWSNPTVLSIAVHAYQADAFEHLPVLADAMEDAGCEDPHILGHLRGQGVHVRGCWVVDRLLGRE